MSTQTHLPAPSAPYLSSPATDAAEAGSQKMPSGREQAVGAEDLRVADRADRAARGGHRVDRLLPARRVADPDRARDRLGVLDAPPVHQRRRALRLEAEQPRRGARLTNPFQ